MKVFLDTNVWLSAIVFPGLCAELLAVLDESGHEILSSALVKDEVIAVLQRKFAQHREAEALFIRIWSGHASCIDDVEKPVNDADARLVKAAAQAGANLFITGDQRVLGWKNRDEMQILSPREAWSMLFAG